MSGLRKVYLLLAVVSFALALDWADTGNIVHAAVMCLLGSICFAISETLAAG